MSLDPEESSLASKAEALKLMDSYLQDRTFLGGTTFSDADQVMFDAIHKTVINMTYADKERYLHVSRWYANLQNFNNVRKNRPFVSFSRNKLY